MIRMVFLEKRDPAQAFWRWAEVAQIGPHALPFAPLRALVKAERVEVGERYAQRVLTWLRGECGMPEDEVPNLRCPVLVLDEDGRRVAL